MGRDQYGHYVNEEGVTIKVSTDSRGKDHVSFYDGPVDGDHSAVHVNIDYDKSSYSTQSHNEDKSESDSSSGGCYLTTACMKHHCESFDDNCYELSTLRQFRDTHVTQEDIDLYYAIAPDIVAFLDGLPNCNEIYESIYTHIVSVCVKAIEDGNYDLAYSVYKSTILELKSFVSKMASI